MHFNVSHKHQQRAHFEWTLLRSDFLSLFSSFICSWLKLLKLLTILWIFLLAVSGLLITSVSQPGNDRFNKLLKMRFAEGPKWSVYKMHFTQVVGSGVMFVTKPSGMCHVRGKCFRIPNRALRWVSWFCCRTPNFYRLCPSASMYTSQMLSDSVVC